MPIHYIDTDSGVAPIITCDVCNERITDARLANVVANDSEHSGRFATVHKKCDHRDMHPFREWEPLEAFLAHLIRNVKLDVERAT